MHMPVPLRSRTPTAQPFPTRGVPGGWRDWWESDPADTVLAALRERSRRRVVTEANLSVELVAEARDAGLWEAHVASWHRSDPANGSLRPPINGVEGMWPSVNGPSALVALDALEAEVRDLLRVVLPDADPASVPPPGG